MIGDRDFQRLFVANRNGNVYIYDISTPIPTIKHTLTTQLKGAIRGMQLDTNKNYVFTGGYDDGEVGVFDIEKPGRVINLLFINKHLKYSYIYHILLQFSYQKNEKLLLFYYFSSYSYKYIFFFLINTGKVCSTYCFSEGKAKRKTTGMVQYKRRNLCRL